MGPIVALNDMIFKGAAAYQVTTQNTGGIYVGGNFIVGIGFTRICRCGTREYVPYFI